ncbi:unnamed protein product [Phytomonas sp. Hart1]|nr:unnamed protein product [Phytomonas sp. Hart1]|eukprot:CCW70295.1 unnamed protein product [Phytomonas sp. isolate Hart1]
MSVVSFMNSVYFVSVIELDTTLFTDKRKNMWVNLNDSLQSVLIRMHRHVHPCVFSCTSMICIINIKILYIIP